MDAISALELYHNEDVIEKAFDNLKELLNMRRTLVSSEQSLDGKLFVEFVALIYLSYIKKQMQDTDLFKTTPCRVRLTSSMSSNVLKHPAINCVWASFWRNRKNFTRSWG